jgi:hypothetical protein
LKLRKSEKIYKKTKENEKYDAKKTSQAAAHLSVLTDASSHCCPEYYHPEPGVWVKGQVWDSWTQTWSGYEDQQVLERQVCRRQETCSVTLSPLQGQ